MTNKEEFRRRYYENIPSKESSFSIFGREVHELLEKDERLKHVPRLKEREVKILTEIGGVPVLGYIDAFGNTRRSFYDYKSGIRKSDGSPRWTQLEVEKHEQLPFYSLLIETYFGKVYPVCKLIWLETRWKPEKHTIAGEEMWTDGRELELTGHYKIFKRYIHPQERENMKRKIRKAAESISADYQLWKKNKSAK